MLGLRADVAAQRGLGQVGEGGRFPVLPELREHRVVRRCLVFQCDLFGVPGHGTDKPMLRIIIDRVHGRRGRGILWDHRDGGAVAHILQPCRQGIHQLVGNVPLLVANGALDRPGSYARRICGRCFGHSRFDGRRRLQLLHDNCGGCR